jgi:hypothetical protein
MDFQLAMNIASIIAAIGLTLSLGIYAIRLQSIYDQVTTNTRRALILFGLAGLCLGLMPLSFIYIPNMMRMWWVLFFLFLLNSQAFMLFRKKDHINIVIVYSIIQSLLIMGNVFLSEIILPVTIPVGLTLFIIPSLCFSFYLLNKNPTPFTGAIAVVTVLATIAVVPMTFGLVTIDPRYFIIFILPVIVSAAIFVSMLQPWRFMVIGSLGFFVLLTGAPIIIASVLSAELNIWLFLAVAGFAGACALAPLSYFMKQAMDTKAKTPGYISLVLIGLVLLATSHANAWAIAQTFGSWDTNFLFIDWIFGVFITASFVLAGASAIFSERGRQFTREIMLMVASAFVMLGNRNLYVLQVELDILYLPLAGFILIGVVFFAYVSLRVHRAGSTGAAFRFFFFVLAALFIGLVAMFADLFPFVVVLIALASAGLLLLGSSPVVTGYLRRTRPTAM